MGLCVCAICTPVACCVGGVCSCIIHHSTKYHEELTTIPGWVKRVSIASFLLLLAGIGMYIHLLHDCGNWDSPFGGGPCWSEGHESKHLHLGIFTGMLMGLGGS